MRCREWEERIALRAGGDLDDQAVERHLQECAECREFAAGLRESLDLLRGAHAEEIPAAAFTAVRARVLARLARPWWKRAWVYAAAAVVLLAAGIGLRRPGRTPDVGQAVSPSNQPPSGGADHRLSWSANGWQAKLRNGLPAVAPAPHRVRLAGDKKRSPAPHRKAETILVKIETGNPDIVIYWIAETKGEE